jgi:type IV pilus assembly protein PilQ
MGDVVMRSRSTGWRRWIASAAVGAVAVGAGCAVISARRVEASPAPSADAAQSSTTRTKAEAKAAQSTTEIRSLDLREGAPEVFVDLEASAPLVWTSFRNADGRVVVELPNTVPGPKLADLSPEEGLISSLAVQKSEEGSRPLTRLVIATRQEVEHSVTADGMKLRIQLSPVDGKAAAGTPADTGTKVASVAPAAPMAAPAPAAGKGKLAFEPLPDQPPVAPAAGTSGTSGSSGAGSAPAMAAGTPDKPMAGPAPTGSEATRLDSIEVMPASGGAVVKIVGDGEFSYSTFALSSPARFVIDLRGVINRAARSSQAVDGSVVERVRVAQFRPAPKPVSRVVFDLHGDTLPTIERSGSSLIVSFGAANGAPAAAAMPAPAPAPAVTTASTTTATSEPAAMPASTTMATTAKKSAKSSRSSKTTTKTKSSSAAPPTIEESTTVKTRATTTTTTEPLAPAPNRPPGASAGQASDLALAQAAPAAQKTPTVSRGAHIESEDASPLPPPPPPPSGPSSVKVTPAKPQGTSSLGSTGKKAPMGKPVDVTPPSTPLQGLAQKAAGTGKDKSYFGEPIDLKVTNADVTDVLRTFAQISGLNVIVQPGVTGTVTAELENVPWDQALEQVLKINGLDYELDGNVMRIAPTDTLKKEAQDKQQLAAAKSLSIPLRTVYQRLSYADAAQVSRLLKTGNAGILTQRGSVMVDFRTNALIIKELPGNMDAVLSLIDLLDAPEPQVMIEARIVETTKRFSRELGVKWGVNAIADAAHGNTTGLVFPATGTGTGGVNLLGNASAGTLDLKLGNLLNTFNLDIALAAAESEGLITILSAPKVATLNNQRAEIQSGLEIPIQTILNNTVTVQFINATLRLDVVPYVTAEGTVEMDIDISKREPQLAFLVPGATNAPISTKDARTRLIVRDGGTAVIGGIYKVTGQSGEDRIPGLSNIPLIGHLFKHKTRDEENDELLIFITPRVIKI